MARSGSGKSGTVAKNLAGLPDKAHEEAILDEALNETFPASDAVELSALRPERDERLAEKAARRQANKPNRS